MSATIYTSTTTSTTRRAGVASAEINGEAVDVAGDLTYSPYSVKREMLIGQSGVQGYSEMPVTGFISMRVRDSGMMSVAAFMSMTDVPVVAVLANGKSVYGNNMTCTEASEVATAEATFSVKFEGTDVTESTT